MRRTVIAVIASACALGIGAGTAMAGGSGNGQFQVAGQAANTQQSAGSYANAGQNAVNSNAPVSIAGGNITGGSSSANQAATNGAQSTAENTSTTAQIAHVSQTGGASGCKYGCGGSGQFQAVGQAANTHQSAHSGASGNQNAVNGNAPVSIAGGNITGGSSSANQTATNGASSSAGNTSTTGQAAGVAQTGGASSCFAGCGGSGQFQAVGQWANTEQNASSGAHADQNAVNANVPVSIAGGNITGGSSSANQTATNGASSSAGNTSTTDQLAGVTQTGGASGCRAGCGGSGQFQAVGQWANTEQSAHSYANANQNAVNANVPVSIAGGNITGGSSSANQTATNGATSSADNQSGTLQGALVAQTGGASGCYAGCGGSGQFQAFGQWANTTQNAHSYANAYQNAVNANVPVSIAGGNIYGGTSSANQWATNSSGSTAGNSSMTGQLAYISQLL
jgi:hypothetical protein